MAQPLCCARRTSQIRWAEAEVAKLAKNVARKPDSQSLRDQLYRAKENRAMMRQAAIDHEADHAGDPAWASAS